MDARRLLCAKISKVAAAFASGIIVSICLSGMRTVSRGAVTAGIPE